LDWSNVRAQFEALTSSEEIQEGGEPISFDALVSGSSEVFEERISKARAYARRLGTDNASSHKGHLFINGKYYVIDDVRSAATIFNELRLIACRAELFKLAASWCRTVTSIFPGEGNPSFPARCQLLTIFLNIFG
jgi:hypothetical protein